jgi:SnoaL-like domain
MHLQHGHLISSTRRDAMALIGLGGAAFALAQVPAFAAITSGSAEAAFLAAFDVPVDQPILAAAARLSYLHDAAIVIDHGAPFLMNKAGYADHLAFQMQGLERCETRFHEIKTALHEQTGIVSAYFIERSKPKDAGFRLRSGYCTAVCTRSQAGWKALSLHLSPLAAQVIDASPG